MTKDEMVDTFGRGLAEGLALQLEIVAKQMREIPTQNGLHADRYDDDNYHRLHLWDDNGNSYDIQIANIKVPEKPVRTEQEIYKTRKHYFTPSDEDHNFCGRCGDYFTDEKHFRRGPAEVVEDRVETFGPLIEPGKLTPRELEEIMQPPMPANQDLDVKAFDEASNHPEKCNCEKCQEWHRQVGPEPE